MKKYRVFIKSIEYLYLDVEAKNKTEAHIIADSDATDGGDFIETGKYDWLIDTIKEIKNED